MILIQCTKTKRDRRAKAKNLYDESGYFRDMKAYAKAKARVEDTEWGILSARHGLVNPETELNPYDERGINEAQAGYIAKTLKGRDVETVEIVAGTDYTEDLVPALEDIGIAVTETCKGEPIGKRREILTRKRREIENETLC